MRAGTRPAGRPSTKLLSRARTGEAAPRDGTVCFPTVFSWRVFSLSFVRLEGGGKQRWRR
eukprot:972674-Rhodomonas_salina.1